MTEPINGVIEFGRTIGDARRLAKQVRNVCINVRAVGFLWGDVIVLSRAAFLKAIASRQGDAIFPCALVRSGHDSAPYLNVGDQEAVVAALRPTEAAA